MTTWYRPCRGCPTPTLDRRVFDVPAKRSCNHVDCARAERGTDTWRAAGAGETVIWCPGCGRADRHRSIAVDVPVRCLCGNEHLVRGTWPRWTQRLWWLLRGPRIDIYPPIVRGPFRRAIS